MKDPTWYFSTRLSEAGFTPTEFLEDLLEKVRGAAYYECDYNIDNYINISQIDERSIQEYVWAILTGLRSCDDGPEHLKALTTARARHIIGLNNTRFSTTRFPLSPKEMEVRDLLLKNAPPHFTQHFYDMADTIKILYSYDIISEQVWETPK